MGLGPSFTRTTYNFSLYWAVASGLMYDLKTRSVSFGACSVVSLLPASAFDASWWGCRLVQRAEARDDCEHDECEHHEDEKSDDEEGDRCAGVLSEKVPCCSAVRR